MTVISIVGFPDDGRSNRVLMRHDSITWPAGSSLKHEQREPVRGDARAVMSGGVALATRDRPPARLPRHARAARRHSARRARTGKELLIAFDDGQHEFAAVLARPPHIAEHNVHAEAVCDGRDNGLAGTGPADLHLDPRAQPARHEHREAGRPAPNGRHRSAAPSGEGGGPALWLLGTSGSVRGCEPGKQSAV
jgi:hypothetical protein